MTTSLGRGTVLFVDPDKDRAARLRAMVSELGCTTTEERTARGALRRVRSRSVNVLAVSSSTDDLLMATFLDTLSRANTDASVIIYGRMISAQEAVAWMKTGVVDILLDPESREGWRQAVQLAFSRSSRSLISRTAAVKPSRADEPTEILHRSRAMGDVLQMVKRVAPIKATVLITGESGTGKDLLARRIHSQSGRKGDYLVMNCSAIPETLLEDELFGHDRGAFTGADSARAGKFEAADGGTLMLDEIGEIPLPVQVKLLRVLEEERITRLGGNRATPVDVRLIAATNRDLMAMVRAGTFREDLYYRIKVVEIHLPPLRKRRPDIPLLALTLLRQASDRHNLPMPEIAPEVMESLKAYSWPGNVRQLKNMMESLLIMCRDRITLADLPPEVTPASGEGSDRLVLELPVTLQEAEDMLVERTLAITGGNRTQAAMLLGMGRRTLQRKLGSPGDEQD
ncbi:MAG: sigma-54 dependent transcriptional regulator [Candidatus Fermentibacteraceae bacterium]